ncbi:MAG: DNA recombination protein RmuC [Pseudomonadota bacterium]
MTLDLSDPLTMGALFGGGMALLLIVLILAMLGRLRDLTHSQTHLTGTLGTLSEAQRRAETHMATSLCGTAETLGALQERLATIDAAQAKIERLSGNVLGLQDILSNKQTRGAFGEIQLRDILGKALPPDAFTWQATLSNGKRADCLIHMPDPPGPLAIDAKFPLEPYEALVHAETREEKTQAAAGLRTAMRTHLRAIASKYILEGETADGALLFLPSEAIYAELHANFGDVVREGFSLRVWIVSPTTCMATLNTLRGILKDHRMREQASDIRRALAALGRDVALVVERAQKLETHFDQARRDLEGITTAAERAGKRADRLDTFDFAEDAAPAPKLAPIIRRG